jgi:methyltransferase (TIGR00027 family)
VGAGSLEKWDMTDDAAITSVADTALWVAAFRAKENRRPDAAFHDPLASILAGDRGARIARSIPHAAMVGWAVVVRASAIDRLISEALQTGVDTVVNLGAGLDTRPYRMTLPADTRWIEVDLPAIVEQKNSKLRDHQPVCRLERIAMDLRDVPARRSLFARVGANSKSSLVITEGLIPYFSNKDAEALASDLSGVPSFQLWIQDFDNAGKRGMPRSWTKKLRAAPFLFSVSDWFEFFSKCGWRPREIVTSAEESERLERPYPFSFPLGLMMYALPKEVRRRILGVTGVVVMQR